MAGSTAVEPGRWRSVQLFQQGDCHMAKKAKKRKYTKSSGRDVKGEMHRYKKGTAKSGPGGKGGKVKSRKQAIAIGLSKARKKGKKVPKKRSRWAVNIENADEYFISIRSE